MFGRPYGRLYVGEEGVRNHGVMETNWANVLYSIPVFNIVLPWKCWPGEPLCGIRFDFEQRATVALWNCSADIQTIIPLFVAKFHELVTVRACPSNTWASIFWYKFSGMATRAPHVGKNVLWLRCRSYFFMSDPDCHFFNTISKYFKTNLIFHFLSISRTYGIRASNVCKGFKWNPLTFNFISFV